MLAVLLASALSSSALQTAPVTAATANRGARSTAFRTFQSAEPACDLPMSVVEGAVPPWLAGGAYVRNGPGQFEAGDRTVEHWFDGFAMLLRVAFASEGGAPLLTTRFIKSDAHAAVLETERLAFAEFMTPLLPPGAGVTGALQSLVALAAGDPTDNACVNLVQRGGGVLEAMTETQRSWFEVDAKTLATRKRVAWEGDKVGQLSTAHAQRDPAGGGWINVGTEISPPLWSSYHVFRLDDSQPNKREILASIPCADRSAPNWLHAFGVTRAKVVVIEQPASYSVGAMLGLGAASHGSIDWKPEQGTLVHVLDRRSGELVTHAMKPAFFFFHIANAFDLPDGGVCLDVCLFDDPTIVTSLRLDRLTNDDLARDLPTSRLTRLTIPADGGPPTRSIIDDASATGSFTDLPSIAPTSTGDASYRFVYGIGASRPTPVSNKLVKTDVTGSGGDAAFEVQGMLPGEPLFVPRPGGTAEDDGVVLSMGTDANGGSSLYVLDASDMRLLARCQSPVPLPAGFHGEWVAPGGA